MSKRNVWFNKINELGDFHFRYAKEADLYHIKANEMIDLKNDLNALMDVIYDDGELNKDDVSYLEAAYKTLYTNADQYQEWFMLRARTEQNYCF